MKFIPLINQIFSLPILQILARERTMVEKIKI